MDTIWESMNIASRISKQIENTDSLVPKSQASIVTPVQDLQELVATINGVRSTLVPFVTSSKKSKVVTDPGFEICLKGIKDTLSDMLSFFKDLEREFAVNTWKTQKVKIFQMDFLTKQKLDNFAALFNPEEAAAILSGTMSPTSQASPNQAADRNKVDPAAAMAAANKKAGSAPDGQALVGPAMIADPEGRELWIKSFGDTTLMVPWPVFVNTLENYFNTNFKEDEEIIKMILNFTKTDYVSAYELAVFLKWFGPLTGSLNRMLESVKGGLLCGFIPAIEANLLLENKREGTYLIRCSKTQPGSFAVTFVDNTGKIKHTLLYSVHPYGLTLKTPPTVYSSLKEFADSHTSKLRYPLGNKYTLKMRLPQFPYGQQQQTQGISAELPGSPNKYGTPAPNGGVNNNNTMVASGGGLDQNQCIVCMDAPLETVFLECGHLACCAKCSEKLKLCPICRNTISRIIPIFRAT